MKDIQAGMAPKGGGGLRAFPLRKKNFFEALFKLF